MAGNSWNSSLCLTAISFLFFQKKSYSLMSQIRKLQGEIPQMAPSTPSLQRGPPSVENPLSNSRSDTREGSKHMDQSAESGDNENDENDSFSKYSHDNSRVSFTDFHQLIDTANGKASPSGSKSKSGKSVSKPSASSKPTVKHAQSRTDNSSSSKSSSKGTAAPKAKSETNSKDSAKSKPSKQSGKHPSSQNKKSPGPGGGKSSGKSQEKKPSQRAKPAEKKKQPKSRMTVESTDESDVEDVRTPSRPLKAANTSASSTSSSASSSSSSTSSSSNPEVSDSARVSKVKLESGKRMPGTKKGDDTFMVKHEPVEAFDHHRTHIDDIFNMAPIVSPIRPDLHEEDRSPFVERVPGMQYMDGKPQLFVRLRRDLINHLPGVYSYGPNVPSTSTQRRKDSTDPLEKKPSAIVKPVKRKQTEFEKEVGFVCMRFDFCLLSQG